MQLHHPSPEILADYASGSVRLSHALCLAAHLEHCDACRQQTQKLSQLGASFFQQLAPETTHPARLEPLKDKVMALLDEESPSPAIVDIRPNLDVEPDRYNVPRSLHQFIRGGYSTLEWTTVSPSIKIATLLKDKDGAQIALSRVKAGGKMPHHRHTGDELTVVLEGSFSDEGGIYRKGDFISRDSRHKHKPVVTKDAECICLMVLDAPIEFTGWFTRLLNPLVRKNHAQI